MNPHVIPAVAGARRFAQLIHYHDHHPHVNHSYGHKPHQAWAAFRKQFRNPGMNAVVQFAFIDEMRKLTREAKARRSGGPLPPLADRASQ